MRYDFAYFHINLLANQNVRYEQYKDKTEFDIFMSQLSYEAVYDLTEVDWSLFVEQIISMGIENFSRQIGWEQVRFKVLVYLQQHLASLCKGTKLESKVPKLEQECARLISEIINDRTPHYYHGDFCGMPRLSFYHYMQSPTLYTEKTPMTQWIEMRQEERRRMYGRPSPEQTDSVPKTTQPAAKTTEKPIDNTTPAPQPQQTTIINIQPGATYNDIHDNTNLTLKQV